MMAHCAWSECRRNYHHNYYVEDGKRIYYGGLPQYLQVGEHQFVEDKLVEMWIGNMVLSW